MKPYPLKFRPILKQTIWGGEKIKDFKHLDEAPDHVGESWEVSAVKGSESVVSNGPCAGRTLPELVAEWKGALVGEGPYKKFGDNFPLLIKFIDAKQDLSIQVHPNDELAAARHNSFGKNEMWYVVGADKGARLISGFSQHITPEEYEQRVHDATFAEVLQQYEVQPGEVFYVPAGRVHGIGAGSFVAEIQQSSDITYRIYDYDRRDAQGNPRQLHTQQAVAAIDFEDYGRDNLTHYTPKSNVPVELVKSPYFTTTLYDMTEGIVCDYSDLDSFVIWIGIEGCCELRDEQGNVETLQAGESVLIPAELSRITVVPKGKVKFLETFV